ncbi:hypothetical protein BS17DRAFT_782795 [Gyrodon lividus]|nr:hypothetical protein BS17DRAFT_782795 [Gyrodon lividus]
MPQLKALTGESALAFLLNHDPEHAQHLGFHIPLKSKQSSSLAADIAPEDVVKDVPGCLTVHTTSQPGEPLTQVITVSVPSLSIEFSHRGLFSYPPSIPYPLQDVVNAPGTLYLRGENPEIGPNGFNAQQFPPYPPLDGSEPAVAGRVTIDFWSDARITGVVTNVDNYVSGGSGTWYPLNN